MPVSLTQIALVVTLLGALGFVWYLEGRGRWRSLAADRFVHGVPWGTLVTVGIVVSFYLLAQGGLRHWSDPLAFPFITWSLFYPTGLLTAGIAHGSPAHLVANTAGTLALAPIAEYAWGHYPPADRTRGAPPADDPGWLARPRFRALVVFPGALLAVAFLTALFSLGPGLGFSGAVFAIAGFAVVNYPVSTVIAVVVTGALQLLYEALTRPVVQEAFEAGPPSPPEWAGIGFQAHLLGFLLGVLAGVALLHRRRRRRRPTAERIFFATVLLGLAQTLWLVVWTTGDDEFVLYRGAGVVFVLLLTALITVAVAGSDRPLPRPLSVLPRAPTRRQLAAAWLAAVAIAFLLGVAGAILTDEPVLLTVGSLLFGSLLLALPALPPILPDRWLSSPISRRQTAIACLAVLTVLVAVPSIPFGLLVVGDDAPSEVDGVERGGYTVAYERNATPAQDSVVAPEIDEEPEGSEANRSGVVVVDEDRELWTVAVRSDVLEYEGNETVQIGDVGWRTTVHVERTGWVVTGNETAYAVDLTVDDETTRSFASEPVRAHVAIEGREIAVVPTDEEFRLRVTENGATIGEAAIPAVNETATIDDLRFATEPTDDTERVVVELEETEVQIATRESYQS